MRDVEFPQHLSPHTAKDDLTALDAEQLARGYQRGEFNPLQVTRAVLDRIERLNPLVNAYVHVAHDTALKEARESTQRWQAGKPLSPLDGIPTSLKGLTDVAGMPARAGSLITTAAPCQQDAPPVRRLREAGAILLGKTNTPEFGWKAVTDNLVHGTTSNAWNTELTPGGSSGGAATAAALNLGVLHQGGDSGGSIRIPAAFSGIFGFKPTFGWTPQWPPSKAAFLSSIGPMTRSPRDAAAMLNVIGRHDARDPYANRGQPEDWGADIGMSLAGLRIAYSPCFGCVEVDPEIASLVERAAQRLTNLGADIVTVDPPVATSLETFRKIWFTASLGLWDDCDAQQREQLDPGLVENAMCARDWSSLDLFKALEERYRITQALEQFNQDFHLLLTPSVAVTPFALNHQVPPDSQMHDWEEWAPFSYPFNLSGQPAASVPCGFTSQGLPVGFQLAGGKHDDVRLLRAAAAYMDAYPTAHPAEPYRPR
ncbi:MULTISPECIES: amidase [unclassified Cobetia]|uniref:amidase n=1 Tax=unclassified Cobetia TaxID=2609414 RepID=UPI00178C96F1|nr:MULTISPECIES: amidase [unclassified Cobetia]MBE2167934.1 amidase [Cobetia sp. 2AS1]MDH2446357.1 amidase [Cobetia sp. 2AS]